MIIKFSSDARIKYEKYIDENCNDLLLYRTITKIENYISNLNNSSIESSSGIMEYAGLTIHCKVASVMSELCVIITDIEGFENAPKTRIGRNITYKCCKIFKLIPNAYGLYCGAYVSRTEEIIWFPLSPRSKYQVDDIISVVGTVVQTGDKGIILQNPRIKRTKLQFENNYSNKTYKTMKQRIRLTESQLNRVIRRCINEANMNYPNSKDRYFETMDKIHGYEIDCSPSLERDIKNALDAYSNFIDIAHDLFSHHDINEIKACQIKSNGITAQMLLDTCQKLRMV